MDYTKLKGTALVTGTSSGIGAAFAERLAREGYDLVLVARRGDRLDALGRRLQDETGVRAVTLPADLTNSEDLHRVEAHIEGNANLTLLVNNAGRGDVLPFTDMPRDVAENMIALNVTALMRLTHAALPGMLERARGTIINVSSGLAYGVRAPFTVYGATKAFVSHFTELLHEEVGSKGIRLQALVPGLTRTNLGGAEEKHFFDQFPKGMVMSPADLVDASLASLSMGELFCFPLVEDLASWDRASQAIKAIGAQLSEKPADRYLLARQTGA
jgi:short-subunit dehydrogenase